VPVRSRPVVQQKKEALFAKPLFFWGSV